MRDLKNLLTEMGATNIHVRGNSDGTYGIEFDFENQHAEIEAHRDDSGWTQLLSEVTPLDPVKAAQAERQACLQDIQEKIDKLERSGDTYDQAWFGGLESALDAIRARSQQ